MAMINAETATQTLSSPAFFKSAGLVVAGSLGAHLFTQVARERVYDVQVTGGDAIYAVGAAALMLASPAPVEYKRPAALGATAAGVRTVAAEYGIV